MNKVLEFENVLIKVDYILKLIFRIGIYGGIFAIFFLVRWKRWGWYYGHKGEMDLAIVVTVIVCSILLNYIRILSLGVGFSLIQIAKNTDPTNIVNSQTPVQTTEIPVQTTEIPVQTTVDSTHSA